MYVWLCCVCDTDMLPLSPRLMLAVLQGTERVPIGTPLMPTWCLSFQSLFRGSFHMSPPSSMYPFLHNRVVQ